MEYFERQKEINEIKKSIADLNEKLDRLLNENELESTKYPQYVFDNTKPQYPPEMPCAIEEYYRAHPEEIGKPVWIYCGCKRCNPLTF